MTFKEILQQMRTQTQALINDTNVEQVAQVAKQIDSLEEAYNAQESELQGARASLVKYVKEYAFKDKATDVTGTEKTPTLDEALAEAFKETK